MTVVIHIINEYNNNVVDKDLCNCVLRLFLNSEMYI